MATYVKEKVFYISIGFWLILGVECFSDELNHILTIKTGGSVTIPCHYDEKNPPQNKSWHSDIDQYNIYTNTTEENLSVIDHPDQSLFTVTMRNLQNKHTGRYSCLVETDGLQSTRFDLYIQVQNAPGVSVMNSSVSGHEGDNVSVQCFYTSGYQNKLKQWCRYKDQGCYSVGRTDTSQNSSVQISDDGRSSFTVLMTGLRLSDSGWYYCSAGDLQVSVQLLVQRNNTKYENTSESDTSSDEADPSTNSKIAINDTEDAWSDHRNRVVLLLWTALPLLALVLVIWRIIQKHNLPTQGQDVCSETEGHVMYDTVVFKKGKNNEQHQVSISRPPDQEEVIYSALKLH